MKKSLISASVCLSLLVVLLASGCFGGILNNFVIAQNGYMPVSEDMEETFLENTTGSTSKGLSLESETIEVGSTTATLGASMKLVYGNPSVEYRTIDESTKFAFLGDVFRKEASGEVRYHSIGDWLIWYGPYLAIIPILLLLVCLFYLFSPLVEEEEEEAA